MPGLDPMLVPGFIYLLCAGWNWSQAAAHRKQAAAYRKRTAAYRAKDAAIEARERALSEDKARLASETRSPRAIPARIYELTYSMLEHAVHAELADVALFSLTESPDTRQMVVDQPHAPWQDYLRLIWELQDDDGVNFTALAALDSRTRRRLAHPVDPE